MLPRHEHNASAFEAALAAERARLVRLCARITGDTDAAEDLAQETLVEAWRALGRLRDPDGLSPWLAAIARNICLRWARGRGRELARRAEAATGPDGTSLALDAVPDGDQDLAVDLERGELADLLDRALALLPAETRAALVESYVYERPRGELAARLGLSEGALRVRLHRGRLALRHALATDLRGEAVALGIALPGATHDDSAHIADAGEPEWRETRIWCPFCGRRRLLARLMPRAGEYSYRCPGQCAPSGHPDVPSGIVVGMARDTTVVAGLTSAKSILSRLLADNDTRYRRGLAEGEATCLDCGQPVPIRLWTPVDAPDMGPLTHGITFACHRCGGGDNASLWHLMVDLPAGRRFWRRHPHMRALPIREISFQGRPALLAGFESVDGPARLEVVSARETLDVLRIEGGIEGEATS
jgi:RNA polymerase sigma factor (sigma-70 family)